MTKSGISAVVIALFPLGSKRVKSNSTIYSGIISKTYTGPVSHCPKAKVLRDFDQDGNMKGSKPTV